MVSFGRTVVLPEGAPPVEKLEPAEVVERLHDQEICTGAPLLTSVGETSSEQDSSLVIQFPPLESIMPAGMPLWMPLMLGQESG